MVREEIHTRTHLQNIRKGQIPMLDEFFQMSNALTLDTSGKQHHVGFFYCKFKHSFAIDKMLFHFFFLFRNLHKTLIGILINQNQIYKSFLLEIYVHYILFNLNRIFSLNPRIPCFRIYQIRHLSPVLDSYQYIYSSNNLDICIQPSWRNNFNQALQNNLNTY